jgi:hypothetical protein
MHARQDELLTTDVDDQVVLLDLRSAHYLRLNSTGRLLWTLLEQDRSPEELAAALQQRYGLAAPTARADVAAFLAALRARDLLEEDTSPGDGGPVSGAQAPPTGPAG